MKNGKYQIALIGAGGIALGEHLPGWRALPDVEVVAVADTSMTALAKAREKYDIAHTFTDWRELLQFDGLDAVDICTPNRTHTEIAAAALQRGLHVLCEKPLATTSAEVLMLRDVTLHTGKMLMTAHHFRFKPIAMQLRSLVRAGWLGDIYYARTQWLRRRKLPARPTFTESSISGGGPCMDIGVHVLDLALWLMDSPTPVSVSATSGKFLADRDDLSSEWGEWDRERMDVEDFAAAFIRFANGATLTLEASWLLFHPEDEMVRLQCYGKRGGFTYPDGVVVGESGKVPWTMRLDSPTPEPSAWAAEIRAFVEAMRSGAPSPVPVEQMIDLIRILEAVYTSAREGREVRLTTDTSTSSAH